MQNYIGIKATTGTTIKTNDLPELLCSFFSFQQNIDGSIVFGGVRYNMQPELLEEFFETKGLEVAKQNGIVVFKATRIN